MDFLLNTCRYPFDKCRTKIAGHSGHKATVSGYFCSDNGALLLLKIMCHCQDGGITHSQNQTAVRQSQHRSCAPTLQWCRLPTAAFRYPYPAGRPASAPSSGGGQKRGTYKSNFLLLR